MHDNLNGNVTSLNFNFSFDKFISTGSDGSIFLYDVNMLEKCSNIQKKSVSFSFVDCDSIEDIQSENVSSLEEEKRISIAAERTLRANKRRAEMIEIVNQLRTEFDFIKEQNTRLPTSMQIPSDEFKIDDRITAKVKADIDEMEDKFLKEKQEKMNKIEDFQAKIKTIMLNDIEYWSMPLQGIKLKETVETFSIAKIVDEFESACLEYEEKKLMEAKNKSM